MTEAISESIDLLTCWSKLYRERLNNLVTDEDNIWASILVAGRIPMSQMKAQDK